MDEPMGAKRFFLRLALWACATLGMVGGTACQSGARSKPTQGKPAKEISADKPSASITSAKNPSASQTKAPQASQIPTEALREAAGSKSVKSFSYKVLETLPHSKQAYTQGFFFHNGKFYQSAGQYGQSRMQICDPATGSVLREVPQAQSYFSEGACLHGDLVYQLTWQEETCFVYDKQTLSLLGQLHYPGEGWGLTSDGSRLILSDGTATLRFLDPATFLETGRVEVTRKGKPLHYLNELEYIEGFLWANVYLSDLIVVIDPATGAVVGEVDCRNLLPRNQRGPQTDVLNGIAFDPEHRRLWLTGKNWPLVFQVSIE